MSLSGVEKMKKWRVFF